jgi:hypothetical protein
MAKSRYANPSKGEVMQSTAKQRHSSAMCRKAKAKLCTARRSKHYKPNRGNEMTNIICWTVLLVTTNWHTQSIDYHRTLAEATLADYRTPTVTQVGTVRSNWIAMIPWAGQTNQLTLESTTNYITNIFGATPQQMFDIYLKEGK